MVKPIMRTIKGKNTLFAVSDSVGVSYDGQAPAHKMANLIKSHHEKISGARPAQLDRVMADFLTDANGDMSSRASATSADSFGASFALLTVHNGIASVTSAGNVSAFLYREKALTGMSEAFEQLREAVTAGEGGSSLGRHATPIPAINFVGSVGTNETLKFYASDSVSVERDDIFLICSNGVTDVLSASRISYILSLGMSDEKTVQRLISEAAARGSEDDITVMLIRNGGKPVKSNKAFTGFARTAALVAAIAVIAAFVTSGIRGCTQKGAIEQEGPSTASPAPETNGDFMSPEDPQSPITPEESFILRTPAP